MDDEAHQGFSLSLNNRSRHLVIIPLFTALTAVGGFVRIPVPPVAFTLQTLFVYMAGSLLPPRQALTSQALFLLLGLAGLPIFTAGGGPGYVLQPTFGYLAAFPLAAWVLARGIRSFSWRRWVAAALTAMAVIFLLGSAGLYCNLRWVAARPVAWTHVMWSGALLFLPAELLKITLTGYVLKRMHKSRGASIE